MIDTFSESSTVPGVPGVGTRRLVVVPAATVLRALVGAGVTAVPPVPVVEMRCRFNTARTSCATPEVIVGVMVRRIEWMSTEHPAPAMNSQIFWAALVMDTFENEAV